MGVKKAIIIITTCLVSTSCLFGGEETPWRLDSKHGIIDFLNRWADEIRLVDPIIIR